MSLVIDGYNLLNVAGIEPVAHGPTPLFRARQGLLNYLSRALEERVRRQTTIVFDAAEAPPRLPKEFTVEQMHVVFARDFPQADELIEELIEEHSAPKSLLIVSSDHRLHRAARRRGAKAMDSDIWYNSLRRRRRSHPAQKLPEKPSVPLSESERAFWVDQFLRNKSRR